MKLAVALVAGLVAGVSSTTLSRVWLSGDAKCIDGTQAAYYVSPGTNVTKFYIYHQGGGWCQTLEECAQRATTNLGSSINYTSTVDMGDGMDRSPAVNPLMNTWTFVYMPYCDGGSFVGSAESPSEPLLYFHGLAIRQAAVSSLKTLYNFGQATDIVVGGGSAGGLAAYLHVDWYAEQAPAGVKARGMPDSGFFLDGNYTRDGKPDYEGRMENLYNFTNAVAGISPACTAAIGYKCLFAYHLLPFIKSPVLALNSAYDATEGDGQCGHSGIVFDWNNASSVNACGDYIRSLMKPLLAAPSAVFLDSCKHHCGEWNDITIDGYTSSTALTTFYNQNANALPNAGYMDQDQPYPCAACCSNA